MWYIKMTAYWQLCEKIIFPLIYFCLLSFQELEFSNLFAVLHCIHSFFAAKVACLDPLFLGNQAAASATATSASTSKAKHVAWHTEFCLAAPLSLLVFILQRPCCHHVNSGVRLQLQREKCQEVSAVDLTLAGIRK